MSDQEFDNYLALLSRLLRLGDKQRDAIAGELRSHLEDRLDELLARGLSRDEAVRQALEEFGDAAGLAAEFVSLSGNKRKRWIMRLMTASVAAIVLIAAGIFTFWPGNNAGPGAATLVAQNPMGAGSAPAAGAAPLADPVQMLKDKLNQPIDGEFVDTPLRDVIQSLQSKSGIQFVLKSKKLEEAGANGDAPVSISLKGVRLRTLLDLLLEPLELTYMTKDGLVLITTPEEAESPDSMIVRVYDCRELLALSRPPGSTRHKAVGGGGFFAIQDQPPSKASIAGGAGETAPAGDAPAASQPNASGGGGFGGSGGTAEVPVHPEISDSENLIEMITTIVDPESWNAVGGPGSIAEYKGLISVASTQDVHEKVERLLNMLHQAANLKELKVTVVE